MVYQVKMISSSLVAGGLVDLVSRKASEFDSVSLKLVFVCACVLDKRITDAAGSWNHSSSNLSKREEKKLNYLQKI